MKITNAQLIAELPSNRPYTRLEALLSLSLDSDNGKQVSVYDYAALWRWPREQVQRFLNEFKGN